MSARGTTNRNDRGSAAARRARRQWLLDEFGDGETARCAIAWDENCLGLVDKDTLSVDRYPTAGVDNGTYSRGNIRPACGPCNSRSGCALREARKAVNA